MKIFLSITLVSCVFVFALILNVYASASEETTAAEEPTEYYGKECTVAGIQLHGRLATYYDPESQSSDDVSTSEGVNTLLEEAEASPYIHAIILEIDSGGGSPVAAQEIVETIQRTVTKPVVVQIREVGASAAYWVATAGDYIFASPLSNVGSIGVTMSYTDSAKKNKREGYTFNEINTGKFKDSGTLDKPLTKDEEHIFKRDIDIIFNYFKKVVAQNRSININDVSVLADGSTMLGEMALKAGLIDALGGYYDVLDYITETQNIEPVVCW